MNLESKKAHPDHTVPHKNTNGVTQQRPFDFHRVGITGGTGTVGSQFIKVLLNQFPSADQILTNCRNPQGTTAQRIPISPRVVVVPGALENPRVLTEIVTRSEVVYHLAAWLANTDMPSMTSVFVTNSLIPALLGKLCAAQNKRLVFTSSHSVYFAGPYEGRIAEDTFLFRRDFLDWIAAVRQKYYALCDTILAGTLPFTAAGAALEDIHRLLPPPFQPKIYDRDAYHVYCLSKLLAERLVLNQGGIVLRLSNVYGPGDESTQAVGEACQRILAADPKVETRINQPFKKLVPAYLGDILKTLIRAGTVQLPANITPVFTMASQENYLREDELLQTVARSLNELQGTRHEFLIERLATEPASAFTYDLGKTRQYLLPGEELTPLGQGVRAQLAWLLERRKNSYQPPVADLIIHFGDQNN